MGKYSEEDILDLIEEEDIKFIRLQFADFFGVLKNIAVTGGQIKKAMEGKCFIDGHHLRGASKLGYRKIYLIPDLDTFAILPWRPQQGKVARFLCDLEDEDGKLIPESPRYILRKVLDDAKSRGLSLELNPECEFYLFDTDEDGLPTTNTKERAVYLDMAPLDSGENARRDIIFALEDIGFEMESSHHEDAPAQHAVSFKKAKGVRMADRILTLRNTVRTVAIRQGFYATFMPKPRTDLPGSAMALNAACEEGRPDIFTDVNSSSRLTARGEAFVAGMLAHMEGMTAIANPIINSYKRILDRFDASAGIFWSKDNYYAPVQVSVNEIGRTQIRWELPDGATNPYLTIAYLIASGIDGMDRNLKIPDPDEKVGRLPRTLRDAVAAFGRDDFLKGVCGESYASVYIEEKNAEWEAYAREVTDWEINSYLGRI